MSDEAQPGIRGRQTTEARSPRSFFINFSVFSVSQWLFFLFLVSGVLSACVAQPALIPTQVATRGPNPTEFIETRVAQILAEQTQTAAAQPPTVAPATATPEAPTAAPTATTIPATETPTATEFPTETLEPSNTPPDRPLPTSGATVTPRPTPRASPTLPNLCTDPVCEAFTPHFWLERPIPETGEYVTYVDRSYPYASTQNGVREPHHGVEFFNRRHTPVLAAAAGTVIAAGDDSQVAYGPATVFYGRLVIVRLDELYNDQAVFNLYGHLQTVNVTVGQTVKAGDQLGTVGESGVAMGPHLHFEVRVGQNDYQSTRNPELWIKPYSYNTQMFGAIAGRVVDTNGQPVSEITVVIRPENVDDKLPKRSRYVLTYASDPEHSINGDDVLQENFAIHDIPWGTYNVSVRTTKTYFASVTVQPGRVAWVTFTVNPPLPTDVPPTPTP